MNDSASSLYARVDTAPSRSINAQWLCSFGYVGEDSSRSTPHAFFDLARLGQLAVLKHHAHGLFGTSRSAQQIMEDSTDDFMFSIPLSTTVTVSQANQVAVAKPGNFFFVTTRTLCKTSWDLSNDSGYAELVVRVPGPKLRERVRYADHCCARAIAITQGAGKIMLSLVEGLIEEKGKYSAAQAHRFGEILLDAIAGVLLEAPELGELRRPHRQSAHERVFEAATAFIDRHLAECDLDVSRVAKHCNVSPSYLHASFAAVSERVGALIADRRVDRCHEALCDPSMRHESIIDIAMRWGFRSSAAFNHAYKTRVGCSPSETRRAQLAMS